MKKIFLALLVILIVSVQKISIAETTTITPLEELLKAKTIRFYFKDGASVVWNKGKVKIEKGLYREKEEDRYVITDSIDYKKGTARAIGNNGAVDEIVFATGTGITFLEQTNSGNVTVTTIFANKIEGTEKCKAVTSRHMDFFGHIIPSQYYGWAMIVGSQ